MVPLLAKLVGIIIAVPLQINYAAPLMRRGGKDVAIARQGGHDEAQGHAYLGRDLETTRTGRDLETTRTGRVIYGFQSANVDRYTSQLEAQFQSWAAEIDDADRLVVGGPYNNVGAVPCSDRDQTCKEAVLYYNAAARLRGRNDFDWLVSLHEDAFAFRGNIEEELGKLDPAEPVIYGDIGCGRGWPYRVESKGNTTPQPASFQDPGFHCEAVFRNGGICGGAGYILSREAVHRIRSPYGSSLEEYLQEYRSHSKPGTPCDLALPCVLYARNVTLKYFPEGMHSMDVDLHGALDESQDALHKLKFWEHRQQLGLLHVLSSNKYDIADFHTKAWSAIAAEKLADA